MHRPADLGAIVAFISNARTGGDTKLFLDACDLIICLATLPGAESADQTVHLRETLSHLQDFFETPLWKSEGRFLYSISRIALHLLSLQKRHPHLLPPELVDGLGDVAEQAKGLNQDGNWEDKIIILETTLRDLQRVKLGGSQASIVTLNEDGVSHGRRPSLMRNAISPALDI